MKKQFLPLLLVLFVATFLTAQSITVQPYLQDAQPNSIYILWETSDNEESVVEWGLTNALGNTTDGTALQTDGTKQIHTVQLVGLERFTPYFYRVKTGAATSDIYSFKTPPFASDNEPFRVVAMSDMQRDGSFPNKFNEIVEQGVMDYLDETIGGNLTDNLALVIIPGDLVVNGNNYNSWANTFFTPSEKLFRQVPVYPVLGNHEVNTAYYFQYFQLPQNGVAGQEEHAWHTDYGNVRIIGLDSNGAFASQDQLDWLDNVLDNTCEADSIDFVFAQLHHPHKSELWTPGESGYTGQVIERLEQFSTTCNKPSIHFFGHTHGYSRGQSRDHKHLWINAATAGGAIDNWGEFPNADYEEFSKSQDNYGFVSVEVTSDDDPKLIIKHISRGDQDVVIDNEVTDSLVMRLNASLVETPEAEFPVEETLLLECVTLKASAFAAPNNAQHGQSHWQVSTNADDFSDLAAEYWKNYENWYYEIDTQAEDDLTDQKVDGLVENTSYYWRVRYRDREMNWSDWSATASFETSISNASPNLVINPSAEDSLAQWTITEGVVEALTAGVCAGINPHSGNRYFAVGGLCEHSDVGRCMQEINVTTYADSIDTGGYGANFGGYLSNYGGSDLPEIRLHFANAMGDIIGTSETYSTLNNTWTLINNWTVIPAETRSIQVELQGTRNAGTDNDSYFDNIFLKLGSMTSDCSTISTIHNRPNIAIPNLQISPNPMTDKAVITLPNENYTDLQVGLVNAAGMKVACQFSYDAGQLTIHNNNLPTGAYLVLVRTEKGVLGSGKLLVVE